MRRLAVLGWWFNPDAPAGWPLPQALVGAWDARERELVLRYLGAGRELVRYDEPSFCRFACGAADMGDRDLTDGAFVWPDGLPHYVERHAVRLPPDFVRHACARGGAVAPFAPPRAVAGLYDPAPWLAWGRAEGACLDLAGWDLVDDAVARRIAAELAALSAAAFARVRPEDVALCRAATREAVLRVPGGGLLVCEVRPGGGRRRLAGWGEWPRA